MIEKERSFPETVRILENACEENENRIARKQRASEDVYEKAVELYLEKLKLLNEIQRAWSEVNREKYAHKYEKSNKLAKDLNEFLQLSYSTLADVLNTSVSCCYKWRNGLKEDWLKSLRSWLDE